MTSPLIGRRTLLAGVAAASTLCATATATARARTPNADDAAATASSRTPASLTYKGVNFDTDREVWRTEYVRREIAAVKDQLHGNAVLLLGHRLDRLAEAASIAAAHGLFVWLEPRQFDQDAEQTLAFLASVARAAESLRSQYPRVGLSIGTELTIFMSGLVPGKDYEERGQALGRPESAGYQERLNAFLGQAVGTVRPLFHGPVTYGSGDWEQVDWHGFDVVGANLYRNGDNMTSYTRALRALQRHGKPVVITEFGCCTFTGAGEQGGLGFTAVDWEREPPPGQGRLRARRARAGRRGRGAAGPLRGRARGRGVRLQLHRARLPVFAAALPRPRHRQLRTRQDVSVRNAARLRRNRAVDTQAVLPRGGRPVPLTHPLVL
ncbi:abortive infection protein [Streptomyces sp. NBC_00273]|uniref:abortive infection protein n=1 Tax=Streptomyces sp. NBC_00273 TaxID=2903644 RepID=UPI002E2B2598|nr:abortive infection protein [Streptomyces sp. NBC_00273]